MTTRIAVFVTPHGFGHAARSCAVINALNDRCSTLRTSVFSTVPRWFFAESLAGGFDYHHCANDVGLVQESPLVEDLVATAEALEGAPWHDQEALDEMSSRLERLGCDLVIADISPFGLRVARRTGLPSILIENFTWDWIYEHLDSPVDLKRYGLEIAADFASPALHIQAVPACRRVATAVAVDPVARAPRLERAEVRRRLGIGEDEPMVLASMGGMGWDYGSLDRLRRESAPWIVVPGGAASVQRRGRLVVLPFHSSLYHPDLVYAADVVVGKLGYSTVAEVACSGVAFAYVERPRFPESPHLARWVEEHVTARVLEQRDFEEADWLPVVEELLTRKRHKPNLPDGAAAAAEVIIERFPGVFG